METIPNRKCTIRIKSSAGYGFELHGEVLQETPKTAKVLITDTGWGEQWVGKELVVHKHHLFYR